MCRAHVRLRPNDIMLMTVVSVSITLCAALLAAPAVGYEPGKVNNDIEAWKLPPAAAESATLDHRLVGLGCGPNHITGTAREEDEFPYPCYAIGVPADLCPTDDDEPTVADSFASRSVASCARYLGEGW